MATRPSRSSSIPIPRSSTSTSPSRNIESILSIPFTVSSRSHPYSSQAHATRASVDDHRSSGAPGVRGASSAAGTSPVRSTARSYPHSLGLPSRNAPRSNVFEPRVIRADSSRNIDPACFPSSPSSARTRRPSGTGRAPSAQRQSGASIAQAVPTVPVSFARPAYLEYAALKHLLQTESPALLPPSRKESNNDRSYSGAVSPSTDSDDDSTASPPPRENPTASLPAVDQVLRLPTRWSEEVRHQSLNVSADGRELLYQGSSCSDRDTAHAAAARTDHPIPRACGIYYYEVYVGSKEQKAHISIGFTGRDVKVSRLPGWEPNSWGYHGDDGCSFATERNGTAYGPTYGLGDVIGCGIDFTTDRAFFTRNGTLIGPVFENVGKNLDLFPSVGLQHSNEMIRANFGHEPFKFDIEYHVQQQRNQSWNNILTTPLDLCLFDESRRVPSSEAGGGALALSEESMPLLEDESKTSINKLVIGYLVHHGYTRTANVLQRQQNTLSEHAGISPDGDVNMDTDIPPRPSYEGDVQSRTRIVNSVMSGDIDAALSETQKCHPSVLEAEEGLMMFKLRCRKFVELILEAGEMKKAMKPKTHPHPDVDDSDSEMVDGMDLGDDMSMDIDDGFSNGVSMSAAEKSVARYEKSLSEAIAYGQSLQADYKADQRPEVKGIFKKTFGILAWDDPLEAGGTAAEVVGIEARIALANELNQAILKSQGRPPHPALETLYRHTAVCIQQLALMGVSAAPLIDMKREFIDI
ncbi:SPRY-domain-containing protein [Armillaria solidipes]|uniref:SPRY-domain-containing protein n=1 Tax=Armillaria solidipes TaxID=1076256 RepID=A0A2H3C2H5_9AGAR|nr:SPRY-domain-containing protein [Armillaria solidipes]